MLERLVMRHPAATIAVVGSAPTATRFDPALADVAIGVNGAALLGHRFDYYLCADQAAPSRDWFAARCAPCRVIARSIASCDRQLYPDDFGPLIPARVAADFWGQDAIELPEPRPPHCIYTMLPLNESGLERLSRRRAGGLMVEATISGQAVQLAWLMGAARVRLFGCRFSVATSGGPGHYFYPASRDETGLVRERQRVTMDRYLAFLRRRGVFVVIHGDSTLTECDERVE
jgi:hypothetical protein